MDEVALEKFPTSESGQRQLSYVSEDFYKKSYVGKWLFQVMGLEFDDARRIVEELPDQLFPETATWGLMYHEMKWQLPVRENISYEERRRLIYQKRDYRAPMTPYRMEQYLEDATGFEVHIADANDPGMYGFVPQHPNVFKVYFLGEETLDAALVFELIKGIKQSHTCFSVNDRIEAEIDQSNLNGIRLKRICFEAAIRFWFEHLLDGSWLLDGSTSLSKRGRYCLGLVLKNAFVVPDKSGEVKAVYAVRQKQYLCEWTRLVTTRFWEKVRAQRASETLRMGLHAKIDLTGQEVLADLEVETKTPDHWFLDGALHLDGSRHLNAIYEKESVE